MGTLASGKTVYSITGGRAEPGAAAIIAATEAYPGLAFVADGGKPNVIILETVTAAP